jgi:Rab guanine nucleotide exchange factor SEC2
LNDEVERTGEIHPRDVTPVIEQRPASSEKPTVQRTSKPVVRDDTAEGLWQAAQEDAAAPNTDEEPSIETEPEAVTEKLNDVDNEIAKEKQDAVRDSIKSTASLEAAGENQKEGVQRLSITIPGSFADDA